MSRGPTEAVAFIGGVWILCCLIMLIALVASVVQRNDPPLRPRSRKARQQQEEKRKEEFEEKMFSLKVFMCIAFAYYVYIQYITPPLPEKQYRPPTYQPTSQPRNFV
jgi:hypothetical protein